jgi:release factor glutamine methyltransferase
VTVTRALDAAAARLRAAGIAEAVLDAELLLRHVLGWDRAILLTRGGEELPPHDEARYRDLVAARVSRRPLQHLTGTQAFWRHEFVVTPDVLVPRPETEVLVETALALVPSGATARMIDVGTGSGCIALSLAAERAEWTVVAVDLSTAALAVARTNADRLGLRDRVRFVRGDLLDAFAGAFDLVVSNPPYVTEEEWRDLPPEVRDHDPRLALVPREGVPALYARLFAGAARVLRPRGAIAVEIGAGQAAAVTAAAERSGFEGIRAVRDLADIPRVIVATRAER